MRSRSRRRWAPPSAAFLAAVTIGLVAAGPPPGAASGMPRSGSAGSSPMPSASPTISPVPTASPIVESADDIRLRMEVLGGFAPIQAMLTAIPVFTLYDDGLAIWRAQPDPASVDDEGFVEPPLRQTRLTSEQVRALIDFALEDGGLAGASGRYHVDGVADAQTTAFTLDVDGETRKVSIYALGIGAPRTDAGRFQAFERLAATLADFDAYLAGRAAVSAFEPDRYLGTFGEDDPSRPDLAPWPWPDLSPDDLAPLADAPFYRVATLTPEQVALVAPTPNGGAFDIGLSAGTVAYRLMLRPLLPDQQVKTLEASSGRVSALR